MLRSALASALLAAASLTAAPVFAQDKEAETPFSAPTFKGLEWRNIGPAFMSGRIADIEIDQHDPATWYVAVGSGGVWKTTNAGTTWTPLFDGQDVYSIGDVTMDPSNHNSVWVGSGEIVGGRHVGFGNGVYRSKDGGKSWEHLGLKHSEHISTIIVHPEDPDTVWVAAQGPLWSEGGDRGLYKTTDGGKTWKYVLSAGPWTGVTDIVMDPREPDRLYAATWQHHRTVAAYFGTGPESGVHMSEDGGETWTKLSSGLPTGNLGKIGLAISPQDPDVVYAAIELDRREGGVWRSADRGQSWEKKSDAVGAGTGPHYYQEIYASPHKFDRLYLVSNTSQVSEDGGATFRALNNELKHVDDHAIAFRPDDPDYILFGSDGGLYETYDLEKSWRFINNLPVTQFYKVAVDDAEPFYFVYGGTQDNNSQGGPSRTKNRHGIRNSDWFVTLFADGHQSATEPGNPDIMYAEWQEGNLARVDRTTGEIVHIQPQPAPGEGTERFNWDSPIYVSRHDPKRIYFASQRLWRSDNRGDSWTAISEDLTRNQERMSLPGQGRLWSWDASCDVLAMSAYNTITSIAESPLNEDLLYAGTDDGLIQVTENGGESWREIEVARLPGVPKTAFVNDIKADLHDENTVYIALDNHKYGDFTPYLYKSTNRGQSWTRMAGDLPEKHLVWRLVQDHENPKLFFAATEFGVFFTVDGGEKWVELNGGMPTISLRDLAIQQREDDLVAASFGRGIYILDDYSALRAVSPDALEQDAHLFPPGRRTWWYIEEHPLAFDEGGSQGHGYFRAPNPPFGAVFTYYLKDGLQTLEEQRQEKEKPLAEAGEDTPFPGWDAVEAERREVAPEVWLTVRDKDGNVVRRIPGKTGKGFHRVAWDLRYPASGVVTGQESPDFDGSGYLVQPGRYTVSLSKRVRGETTELVGPQPFEVNRLRKGALEGATPAEAVAFWKELEDLQTAIGSVNAAITELEGKADLLKAAIARVEAEPDDLEAEWAMMREELHNVAEALNGQGAKNSIGEIGPQTPSSRLGKISIGVGASTYGPTPAHRQNFEWAKEGFEDIRTRVVKLREETVPALEKAVLAAGGPAIAGGALPE
ncbi:MAG: glycosyl hydrolase [Maricaulaceae bacterium]